VLLLLLLPLPLLVVVGVWIETSVLKPPALRTAAGSRRLLANVATPAHQKSCQQLQEHQGVHQVMSASCKLLVVS
jgi:hypothetical protein